MCQCLSPHEESFQSLDTPRQMAAATHVGDADSQRSGDTIPYNSTPMAHTAQPDVQSARVATMQLCFAAAEGQDALLMSLLEAKNDNKRIVITMSITTTTSTTMRQRMTRQLVTTKGKRRFT